VANSLHQMKVGLHCIQAAFTRGHKPLTATAL
jgi:hypothetical protein